MSQDTVDGFIRAATIPGILGETINLGTGETFSIGEFANRYSGVDAVQQGDRS